MSSSSPLGSTLRSLRLLRGYALVAALLLRTSWGFKTVGGLEHVFFAPLRQAGVHVIDGSVRIV
jgi:hypothetical protein